MISRGFIYLYLSLVPMFLGASALWNDPYWHTLLHFRNDESEIDDPRFFLAKNGKFSPKDELNATINQLQNGSINCKFPARVSWILEKLPRLNTKSYKCQEFEDIISEYNPNYIYIIFPTAHINSPASMYGHTFLRIDSDKNSTLISNAMDYAAQTDENNGLLYAYNGLMGGYKGRYSISPYYDKIKEYNDMERRDIWEYELKLNKKEIKRLLAHQHELKDIYSDYFFFTQNCSYNLLWLLEAAKPSLKLVNQFNFKSIPIDTLRAIEDSGQLGKFKFRPSKSKKMKEIRKNIKYTKNNSLRQKALKLDFQIEELRYKRAKNKIEKKEYVKSLMNLLRNRSKIDIKSDYKIKTAINPLLGHKTNRLSVGVFENDSFLLSFKPSFHDKFDIDRGFTKGSFINFFNLELVKNRYENFKLKKFDFVDISSYAPRDEYFKLFSWSVVFGFDRDYKDDLNFRLGGGVGQSFDFSGFLYYVFLNPSLYIKDEANMSISPEIGFIKNYKDLKFGASFKREFLTSGDEISYVDTFLTYQFKKDIALNLKHDITDSKKRASISLFYYF